MLKLEECKRELEFKNHTIEELNKQCIKITRKLNSANNEKNFYIKKIEKMGFFKRAMVKFLFGGLNEKF